MFLLKRILHFVCASLSQINYIFLFFNVTFIKRIYPCSSRHCSINRTRLYFMCAKELQLYSILIINCCFIEFTRQSKAYLLKLNLTNRKEIMEERKYAIITVVFFGARLNKYSNIIAFWASATVNLLGFSLVILLHFTSWSFSVILFLAYLLNFYRALVVFPFFFLFHWFTLSTLGAFAGLGTSFFGFFMQTTWHT